MKQMFYSRGALLQHILEGLNKKQEAGVLSGQRCCLTLTIVAAGVVFRLKDIPLALLFLLLTAFYLIVSRIDSSTFWKSEILCRFSSIFFFLNATVYIYTTNSRLNKQAWLFPFAYLLFLNLGIWVNCQNTGQVTLRWSACIKQEDTGSIPFWSGRPCRSIGRTALDISSVMSFWTTESRSRSLHKVHGSEKLSRLWVHSSS